MSAMKPVAGLTSGLLARKGAARPAMRSQFFGNLHAQQDAASASADLDDLGWNDLGEDLDLTGPGTEQVRRAPASHCSPGTGSAFQDFLAKRIQFASSPALFEETPVDSDMEEPLPRQTELYASAPSTLLALSPKAVREVRRAVTVRVTGDRYNQLREACNDLGCTAQRAFSLALEQWLEARGSAVVAR